MRRPIRDLAHLALVLPVGAALAFAAPLPASALSELQQADDLAPPQVPLGVEPVERVPLPDAQGAPAEPVQPAAPEIPADDGEEAGGEDGAPPRLTQPDRNPDLPAAEVLYDLSLLPVPTRRMRELIIEACRSGDIEALRPLIGTGDSATQLSLADAPPDPVTFLKNLAGDEQGHEILAILSEVLEAGYVHLEAGTPDEMYVWPYFFALPLDSLSAPQRVELFRIVTAGDYEEMRTYGTYIFYRVGISPEGRWSFFVAGE